MASNNCFAYYYCYYKEVRRYAKPESVTEQQVFSEVYHSLIHSPALDTLLNLEHTYALTIEDLIQQRDKDLEYLDDRWWMIARKKIPSFVSSSLVPIRVYKIFEFFYL